MGATSYRVQYILSHILNIKMNSNNPYEESPARRGASVPALPLFDVTASLRTLDGIFERLMASDEDYEIDAQLFADAWLGAKQFRDQTLLPLARYVFFAIQLGDISKEKISRRLIDFTFRFLTPRQIAFSFDLVSTLVDSSEFEAIIKRVAPSSPYYTARLNVSLESGLEGTYFFDPAEITSTPQTMQSHTSQGLTAAVQPSVAPLEIPSLFGMDFDVPLHLGTSVTQSSDLKESSQKNDLAACWGAIVNSVGPPEPIAELEKLLKPLTALQIFGDSGLRPSGVVLVKMPLDGVESAFARAARRLLETTPPVQQGDEIL